MSAESPVPPFPLIPDATDATDARAEPVVVDTIDHHGRVVLRQRVVVQPGRSTFTIGRSVAADVMIDDPHSAPIHVDVSMTPDGALTITDHGSINGVFVDGERHRSARNLAVPGGRLQVGRTHLRIHTAHQPLPAERSDHGFNHRATSSALTAAIAGGIGCLGIIWYFAWVSAARDTAMQIVIGLAGGTVIAAVWISFWSLLSRIIGGQPRWLMHAAIAFCVTAVGLVVDWVFDVARFSFALPQWSMRGVSLLAITFAVALYLHLTQVWTLRRKTGAALAAILPLLLFGTISWVQDRSEARNVNFIGVREKVFPPALKLRDGIPVERYFGDAVALRDEADAKRREIPADDNGDADED